LGTKVPVEEGGQVFPRRASRAARGPSYLTGYCGVGLFTCCATRPRRLPARTEFTPHPPPSITPLAEGRLDAVSHTHGATIREQDVDLARSGRVSTAQPARHPLCTRKSQLQSQDESVQSSKNMKTPTEQAVGTASQVLSTTECTAGTEAGFLTR
jgi:hypothetical protein